MHSSNLFYVFFIYAILNMILATTVDPMGGSTNNNNNNNTAWGVPFHAVPLNVLSSSSSNPSNHTTWICNQGFYKTAPPNPVLSTCKKCLIVSQENCSHSSKLRECTPLWDAACEECPALPSYWIYTPNMHDCKTKQCNSGYFNHSSPSNSNSSTTSKTSLSATPQAALGQKEIDCWPCPFGSYCQNSIARECGTGLITFTQGSTNPLQCVPSTFESVQQVQITIFFTVQSDSNVLLFAFCPHKDKVVSTWLQYGRVIECSSSQGANEDNVGEFQIDCILFSTQTFLQQFLVWLYNEVEIRGDWMKGFVRDCISQEQEKIITSWYIRILDMPTNPIYASLFSGNSTFFTDNNNNSSSSSNEILNQKINQTDTLFNTFAPRLFRIVAKWGTRGRDIVNFVLVLIFLSSAMCISIFFLITGIILRMRKGWKLRSVHEVQLMQIKKQLL